jgi:protein-disulfide isomerase-like protein with CxxC motif
MAEAVATARAARPTVAFELVLGGINVHSTQPVGRYGRQRLTRLWAEVAEVTGARFAGAPSPEPFVYNSLFLCRVLEAARALDRAPPFGLLQALQTRFFAQGLNVTAEAELVACIEAAGHDSARVLALARSDEVAVRVARGFQLARAHGTHALPSVVLAAGNDRRLLAGGYVDAPTLIETIDMGVRKSLLPPA